MFRDFFRFDKYSYDFVLDAEEDVFTIENLENKLTQGTKLKEMKIAEFKDEVVSGVVEFCKENPLFGD